MLGNLDVSNIQKQLHYVLGRLPHCRCRGLRLPVKSVLSVCSLKTGPQCTFGLSLEILSSMSHDMYEGVSSGLLPTWPKSQAIKFWRLGEFFRIVDKTFTLRWAPSFRFRRRWLKHDLGNMASFLAFAFFR